MFLTTHDMLLVDELCDRVAFLVDGAIAATGIPRDFLIPILMFTEPAVIGLFFVGSFLLLERQHDVLHAMMVTPVREWEVLAARVTSYCILGIVMSVIPGLALKGLHFRVWLLILYVVSTAAFHTLVGMAVSLQSRTFNHYILRVGMVLMLLQSPLMETIQIVRTPLFRIVPGAWAIEAFKASFSSQPLNEKALIFGWLYLVCSTTVLWWWFQPRFRSTVLREA